LIDHVTCSYTPTKYISFLSMHTYLELNFTHQHLVTAVYESHSLLLAGRSKLANSFLLSFHLKQISFNYFQQRQSDVVLIKGPNCFLIIYINWIDGHKHSLWTYSGSTVQGTSNGPWLDTNSMTHLIKSYRY